MSYRGNHSSLYATVQLQGVQELEVAIHFQVREDYADALEAFELLDESVSKLPVAHFENATLYERIELKQERLKFLNAVEVQSKEPRREHGADEWDLLNLLRANADALSEACIIAVQVNQKSNDNFSDLEVHYVFECWHIFALCRARSNYLETEHEDVLGGFPNICEVRRILHDQGRFHLARSLIRHEEWIEDYSTPEFTRDATEPTRTELAFTLLFYAEALALAGKSVESSTQLDVAKAILRKAGTHSQHSALEIPARAQLLIDRVHAKSHQATTAKERKNISLAYANKAEALKDWPIYREHMRAAIRQSYEAREAAELESRAAEAKNYLNILKRYLEFEDSIVYSAAFLGSAVSEFGLTYVRQGASQLEDYLTMVKDSEKDFPDFSIPQDMVNLAQSASRAARDLGNRRPSCIIVMQNKNGTTNAHGWWNVPANTS
ncbi:hypothetical protein ABVK25_009786 [Lepraria finkii]|uniref:Uncharacterized protein n=1 Tax=Lepraria finkii TaxID=1340010 RepID=A0ABR4AW70_9LECA